MLHCNSGYGAISGLTVGGNVGCPPCGPEGIQTQGKSKFLNKVIYVGARRFLNPGHELRKKKYDKHWGNQPETREVPIRPSGRFWKSRWQDVEDNKIPLNKSGMVTLSCFHRLPYFQVLYQYLTYLHYFFATLYILVSLSFT